METLLEAIRLAAAPEASPEIRAAGAQACRTILAALETKPGEELANSAPLNTTTQVAQMIGTLRGVPIEQLLDLAIARVRAALPSGSDVPRPKPLNFHVVQIPRKR